jgi:hypothetical protein
MEVECDHCGKGILRPTLINGLRLCGTCVLTMDEDQQVPQAKHVTDDWRSFSRGKRKHHPLWR